jgi:hypothetical protein
VLLLVDVEVLVEVDVLVLDDVVVVVIGAAVVVDVVVGGIANAAVPTIKQGSSLITISIRLAHTPIDTTLIIVASLGTNGVVYPAISSSALMSVSNG